MIKKIALVVDNSVVMSWLFEDEVSAYADHILDQLPEMNLLVPAIWSLEVSNVLLVAEKRGRLSNEDINHFVNLLMQLPIEVVVEDYRRSIPRILALGRANEISAYDAAYLDLAIQNVCPLATLDNKLIEAAKRCGVPMFPASWAS
jgi:predicted nucleic acid-binding protein